MIPLGFIACLLVALVGSIGVRTAERRGKPVAAWMFAAIYITGVCWALYFIVHTAAAVLRTL